MKNSGRWTKSVGSAGNDNATNWRHYIKIITAPHPNPFLEKNIMSLRPGCGELFESRYIQGGWPIQCLGALFLSGFPTKIPYAFISSPMSYMPSPS
jgi:hypothetical protein